jgi:hypothetical protein
MEGRMMPGIGHNGPPAPELLTRAAVFTALADAIREAGGQKAWAAAHGIAPQHLNDVLNARREISDRILVALGLRAVTRYARVSISAARPVARETQETQARPAA